MFYGASYGTIYGTFYVNSLSLHPRQSDSLGWLSVVLIAATISANHRSLIGRLSVRGKGPYRHPRPQDKREQICPPPSNLPE
jgi:hypothetical protein